MGCGKSTVGALLAKRNGMSFIDLDDYIEKKENKTVAQIFEDNGEEYFRMLEREAVKELSEKRGVIIAAGGGTLTFKENTDNFRKSGIIILLDIPVENIASRLQNDKTRPLLNREDKDEVMRELYNKRLPVYREAADITVNANRSPMSICTDIMQHILHM